jgi:erythromycin esterase-like protein
MASLRRSIASALLSVCGALASNSGTAKTDADMVVHDLCGKRIALLGESGTHGFGRTMQFKAELVRRLIDECHYSAFFIESGIYDFLNIQKKLKSGQEVTAPMIAAAIGKLWAVREVEPLIPFLLEKARTRKVVLGGLDDQLGMGTYAVSAMLSDLTEYLPREEKSQCLAILQKHMMTQYDSEVPHGSKEQALVGGCLDSIQTAVSKIQLKDAPLREYDSAMVESLKRCFARDFPQGAEPGISPAIQYSNGRDKSMYLNFRWLISHLPAHSKVIVWAATIHLAEDVSVVPGHEGWATLGPLIYRDFKSQSFVLGFSAYSGSYAAVTQPAHQLSPAPGNSLEGKAFANNDSDTLHELQANP